MGRDQPAPPGGSKSSKLSSRESARHVRVAFSENSGPSYNQDGAFHPPPDLDGERPKRFRPRCYACCAWGCMLLFALMLLALLVGFVFIATFHSYLPVIRVRGFNATKIEFGKVNKGKVNLKGKVEFLMEFNNKNEKTELKYGDIKVKASAAQIPLGKYEFRAFNQAKKSSKSMNASIGINHAGVEKDDAEQLKQDIKNQEVDLKLFLSGKITFPIAGIWMNDVPLNAQCDCLQKEIDFGNNAKCNYRVFNF